MFRQTLLEAEETDSKSVAATIAKPCKPKPPLRILQAVKENCKPLT
jgi:hypothetical protein